MSAVSRMIAEIEADTLETAQLTGRPVLDGRVLAALRRVPREAFMPDAPDAAYENRAHPISHGQTISQPFIVAIMTDLLDLGPDSRVLEIGTGSGYQTAILAELAKQVWSVEVIEALSQRAAQVLAKLDYVNVNLRAGDGNAGWADAAPFDAIIVTAAAPRIPPALIEQLAAPGRMVVPVGAPFGEQTLWLVEKDAAGVESRRRVMSVAFVPLVGGGIDLPGQPGATDPRA